MQKFLHGGDRITQTELYEFLPDTIHPTHEATETSKHSLLSIQADLGDMQELVLSCIEEHPSRNDREITELLNLQGHDIARCSVVARRNELVKMGYIKCSNWGTDKKTGMTTKFWEAIN